MEQISHNLCHILILSTWSWRCNILQDLSRFPGASVPSRCSETLLAGPTHFKNLLEIFDPRILNLPRLQKASKTLGKTAKEHLRTTTSLPLHFTISTYIVYLYILYYTYYTILYYLYLIYTIPTLIYTYLQQFTRHRSNGLWALDMIYAQTSNRRMEEGGNLEGCLKLMFDIF